MMLMAAKAATVRSGFSREWKSVFMRFETANWMRANSRKDYVQVMFLAL